MGYFVPPPHAFRMLGQLNARFAEGDPIAEMAALQQEFSIFSDEHDLRASFSVLGISPTEGPARDKWLQYLDYLKTLPSSDASLNGHDLIRRTLQQDLEGDARPVFFRCHAGDEEPRVVVTVSRAVVFSDHDHIEVTVPAQSARAATRAAVKRAPPSAARRAARAAAPSKGGKPPQAGKASGKKAGKAGQAKR